MNYPLVSVIMPAYNSARYLRDAVASVTRQDGIDWELLIVDDRSTDATWEIASNLAQDPRITALQLEANAGTARARNFAIQHAKGRYIAFLDADDRWHPGSLRAQIEFMRKTDYVISYRNYDLIDENGDRIGGSGSLAKTVDYRSLLKGCIMQNSTVIYDTERSGGKVYCPDIRKRQDFALFLRILRPGGKAGLATPGVVACDYRISSTGVSSRKSRNIPYQWRVYRRVENFGRVRSSYYLCCWFVFAARKWFSRTRK